MQEVKNIYQKVLSNLLENSSLKHTILLQTVSFFRSFLLNFYRMDSYYFCHLFYCKYSYWNLVGSCSSSICKQEFWRTSRRNKSWNRKRTEITVFLMIFPFPLSSWYCDYFYEIYYYLFHIVKQILIFNQLKSGLNLSKKRRLKM